MRYILFSYLIISVFRSSNYLSNSIWTQITDLPQELSNVRRVIVKYTCTYKITNSLKWSQIENRHPQLLIRYTASFCNYHIRSFYKWRYPKYLFLWRCFRTISGHQRRLGSTRGQVYWSQIRIQYLRDFLHCRINIMSGSCKGFLSGDEIIYWDFWVAVGFTFFPIQTEYVLRFIISSKVIWCLMLVRFCERICPSLQQNLTNLRTFSVTSYMQRYPSTYIYHINICTVLQKLFYNCIGTVSSCDVQSTGPVLIQCISTNPLRYVPSNGCNITAAGCVHELYFVMC